MAEVQLNSNNKQLFVTYLKQHLLENSEINGNLSTYISGHNSCWMNLAQVTILNNYTVFSVTIHKLVNECMH